MIVVAFEPRSRPPGRPRPPKCMIDMLTRPSGQSASGSWGNYYYTLGALRGGGPQMVSSTLIIYMATS